jgi:serine/threonine protein kinase
MKLSLSIEMKVWLNSPKGRSLFTNINQNAVLTKWIDGTELRTVIGTEAYLPPEVRGIFPPDSEEDEEHTFSFAVDIWAVGSITYRMVTGHTPFPPGRKLFDYVVKGRPFPVDLMLSISPECTEFVTSTMAASARLRPTSEKALTHAWFSVQYPDLIDPDPPSTARQVSSFLMELES